MSVYSEEWNVSSQGGTPTFLNITQNVQDIVQRSGIQEGIVTVVTIHTTCAVFYEEFVHDLDSSGMDYLQLDLEEGLEKIFPKHTSPETYHYPGPKHYEEVLSWPNAESYLPNGDQSALWNGDAHLKATLLGASETFVVEKGQLWVGNTGYVYFVDFDGTRSRTRTIKVVVMGE